MHKQVLQAYKHFRQSDPGGIVGENAKYCLSLARIEYIAAKSGIVPQWEPDYFADTPEDWGWEQKYIDKWNKSDHYAESCCVVTAEGDYAASLSGIWDADMDYRRLIEAELLLDAIPLNNTGLWLFSQ